MQIAHKLIVDIKSTVNDGCVVHKQHRHEGVNLNQPRTPLENPNFLNIMMLLRKRGVGIQNDSWKAEFYM